MRRIGASSVPKLRNSKENVYPGVSSKAVVSSFTVLIRAILHTLEVLLNE